MVFSPSGNTLVTGVDAGTIRIWSIQEPGLLQMYDAQTQGISCVDASPDGNYFAYGRSDGAVVLARMPLRITRATTTGNEVTLHWQGGSGLYQLQTRSSLATGEWNNFRLPTTATSHPNKITREPVFYRVVSLPNVR